jgi:hypothetical protein
MPTLKLNPEELAVESFEPTAEPPAVETGRPRTFEPGCTRDFCRLGGDA